MFYLMGCGFCLREKTFIFSLCIYNALTLINHEAPNMSSYKELLKQRQDLEQQINEARTRELADAVAKVRTLIAEYELTADDVFPPARARASSGGTGAKVAPKYRDPATGQTWTGRGKPPKWIADQDREQFVI